MGLASGQPVSAAGLARLPRESRQWCQSGKPEPAGIHADNPRGYLMTRYVFSSHSELAHAWAQNRQSEGRASRMFFNSGKIYSYGRHFCIARILPSGVVAFTTQGYSVSTSKHKLHAQRACSHREIVFCDDPDNAARHNMDAARASIARSLESAQKPRIRETTRVQHRADALRTAEEANAYLAALPELERVGELPIDTGALESVREEMARVAAARAAAEETRQQAARAIAAEHLTEWRQHARHGTIYALPPALRLSRDGSEVQTSHGARIPVSDARILWPTICAARAGNRAWNPGRPIGDYRLTEIRADGSIIVGCHDIAYSEIAAIAVSLGLVEEVQA